MFGIDISRWQGNYNISKAVKDHKIEFLILKIGGGDNGLYKDRKFDDYYAQCKQLGIPVGCYFFGNANTMEEARKEANYWLSLMKGKQFDFPVFYDVESKDMLGAGKIMLTNIVNEVCQTVENAGYWVGIYSSLSYFNTKMNDAALSKFTHWVAQWDAKKPSKLKSGSDTHIWQYKVAVLGDREIDHDISYINYSPIIKSKGLNGYKTPNIKSDLAIAKEVLAGLWGNGNRRKQALKEHGYDYNVIQKIVNKLVKEGKK